MQETPRDEGTARPEGCVLVIVGADGTVRGRFVWRFGALLAADRAGHALLPQLPLVPAGEQS